MMPVFLFYERFRWFGMGLMGCLYAYSAQAQHSYTTNTPLKIYAEPNGFTKIKAIVLPKDSMQVLRICRQAEKQYLYVLYSAHSEQKNKPNEAAKSLNGFVALRDLDSTDIRTKHLLGALKTRSAVDLRWNIRYPNKDKQVKVVELTYRDKHKQDLETNMLMVDDFFGNEATVKHIAPSNMRYFTLRNDDYVSCKSKKSLLLDPRYRYTLTVQLQKRYWYNALFRRSKIVQIDSVNIEAEFEAVQAVRRKDSCIVWHEDNSHTNYKWSGGCKDGYANGFGTIQFDTNRVYTGNVLMGMLHGEGTLRDDAWELRGDWQAGELLPDATVHTVLYYQNLLPATDTARHKMYPNYAPISRWYAERHQRLIDTRWKYGSKGFRRNDVPFPYVKTSYQIVLPDNENPAYKTYAPTECVQFTRWKYAGLQGVGLLFGDAPFFNLWCSKKETDKTADARLYYWAEENKWYWWGLTHSSGPYPSFADAVRRACGCKH